MTQTTPRPGRFPWYKERLKWKYIQSLDSVNKQCCNKWQFLPKDVDDFRSGLPVRHNLKRSKISLIPPVIGDSTTQANKRLPGCSSNHYDTVYSRTAPRIQKQKSRIEEAQSSLQQHPLGLYPHFEDSLPTNISNEVIEILDPCLRPLADNSEQLIYDEEPCVTDQSHSTTQEEENDIIDGVLQDDDTIYRFPLRKSKKEEQYEAKKAAEQNAISPEQEQAVNTIMTDLVEWINKLGDSDKGEYINEATIKKLFTSDYESKPVLTAPIHVVQLSPRQPSFINEATKITGLNYQHIPTKNDYLPRSVMSKYGVWYLDIKFWKYRSPDEPLLDPKEINEINDAARKAKNLMLDNAILDTHGAASFKEFITSKGTMMLPKFLKNVGRINSCKTRTTKTNNK